MPSIAGDNLGARKDIYIEPLIGHFRHPLAFGNCGSQEKTVSILYRPRK